MFIKAEKLKRIAIISGIALAVLGILFAVGLHFAARILKTQVEKALGPDSEVGTIALGWSAIEVLDLKIHAPHGWPSPDTLRAKRIVIKPDLSSLLLARIQIRSISVEEGYLSVLRPRSGAPRLLPSLLETPAKTDPDANHASRPVSIGEIELRNGVLEFFDASVAQPAHKIRLEQLQAKVENLHLPDLAGRTRVQLTGNVKGVQHNGQLSISGWAELAEHNSELSATLHQVDLIALQPYLIKAAEAGVRQGSMDLDLNTTVAHNHLHAPGTVTLTGLELTSGSGAFNTFMGLPRTAIVNSLKDRHDQIVVHFTLDGNLDDPHFSLNNTFAERMGTSIAEKLGISIEGLTRGVGTTAQGVGGVIKQLLGK